MAFIGPDRRIERVDRQGDGSFIFTIIYTAAFSDAEVGQLFDDSVKIWERDSSSDDRISAYAIPETFRADVSQMVRTKRFTLSGQQANTESGSEELYAWIWLRRNGSTGRADDEQKTPFRQVDA